MHLIIMSEVNILLIQKSNPLTCRCQRYLHLDGLALCLPLNGGVQGVEICFSYTSALDGQQAFLSKTCNELVYRCAGDTQVLCHERLARKAVIVMPSILEELCIDSFFAQLKIWVVLNCVWVHREPRRNPIKAVEFYVALDLLEVRTDVFHGRIIRLRDHLGLSSYQHASFPAVDALARVMAVGVDGFGIGVRRSLARGCRPLIATHRFHL